MAVLGLRSSVFGLGSSVDRDRVGRERERAKDRVKQLTKNCRTDDRQAVHLFSFVVDHVLPLFHLLSALG